MKVSEGKWQPFDSVVRLMISALGSKIIAWDDLEEHLKLGRIRGKAIFNKIHEIHQVVVASEERKIPASWWKVEGRFGRLHGIPVLWTEVDAVYANSWAGLGHIMPESTVSITDLMLWLPDVLKCYPAIEAQVQLPADEETDLGRYGQLDRPLLEEMRELRCSGAALSDTAAAQRVVARAAGGGSDDSRIRRLRIAYKKRYGSKL